MRGLVGEFSSGIMPPPFEIKVAVIFIGSPMLGVKYRKTSDNDK